MVSKKRLRWWIFTSVIELSLQEIQVGATRLLSMLCIIGDHSPPYLFGTSCFGPEDKQVWHHLFSLFYAQKAQQSKLLPIVIILFIFGLIDQLNFQIADFRRSVYNVLSEQFLWNENLFVAVLKLLTSAARYQVHSQTPLFISCYFHQFVHLFLWIDNLTDKYLQQQFSSVSFYNF